MKEVNKNNILNFSNLANYTNFAKYEVFIIVGVLMSIGVVLKIVFHYPIDSDWFWLLAGLGLVVEGSISLAKQKKFDKKFKIIEINDKNEEKN